MFGAFIEHIHRHLQKNVVTFRRFNRVKKCCHNFDKLFTSKVINDRDDSQQDRVCLTSSPHLLVLIYNHNHNHNKNFQEETHDSNLGGVHTISEWVSFQDDAHSSFHVYIEILILEWKCGKSIGESKTWVSWSAQPIRMPNFVSEWAHTSLT